MTTFFDSLRDDLVQRSSELAAERRPASRRRKWPVAAVAVLALGAGGTSVAVATLNEPDAVELAVTRDGGQPGLPAGSRPVTLQSAAGADAAWQVAGYTDVGGGLGIAASTQFDRDPASGATGAEAVAEQIKNGEGAAIYGVVQTGTDPQQVVIYGAADLQVRSITVGATQRWNAEIEPLTIEPKKAALSDARVALRASTAGTGVPSADAVAPTGPVVGEVRLFAVETRLPAKVTADDVNGYVTSSATAAGEIALTVSRRTTLDGVPVR